MSKEESPKELFDRLLTDLEKSPEEIPASIFAAYKVPLSSLTQAAVSFHCSSLNIIKVMKSGIFYMGGLKGRPLSGKNLYKVYFIKDLADFILGATYHITFKDLLKDIEESFRHPKPFDEAIAQIEKLENIAINIYCSKRHSAKLNKMRKELETIKLDIIDKTIVFPAFLRGRPDRIDHLISHFKDQIPLEAPVSLISEAISTLLKTFDIFVEPESIRQRLTRNNP